MNQKAIAGRAFIDWLKKNDPFLFEVAMARHAKQTAQGRQLGFIDFGNFDIGALLKTTLDTVKDVAPQVIQAKQQYDLVKAQIKRAETGLPPLDVQAYQVIPGTQTQYVPTQYDASLVRQYTGYQQPKTNWMLWVLGAGGLALVALFLRRKSAV